MRSEGVEGWGGTDCMEAEGERGGKLFFEALVIS